MSLADEIRALQPTQRCGVCAWYDQQDPEAQKEFDTYADTPGANISALYRICAKNGLDRSDSVFKFHINRHRGQE